MCSLLVFIIHTTILLLLKERQIYIDANYESPSLESIKQNPCSFALCLYAFLVKLDNKIKTKLLKKPYSFPFL